MFDISKLIASDIRVKLLRLFLIKRIRPSGVRELSRLAHSNAAAVSKELRNLSSAGVLTFSRENNRVIYFPNESCAALPELKGLLTKSTDYVTLIGEELARIKGVNLAFIFGSFAAEKAHPKSDLDLFIIGRPDLNELNARIRALENRSGLEVDYIVMPAEEFLKKRKMGFVKNVLSSPKIFVVGDERAVERLAEKRKD